MFRAPAGGEKPECRHSTGLRAIEQYPWLRSPRTKLQARVSCNNRRLKLSTMPDLTTYLAFLVAVLAYQLSGPGPDMLLVMSRGFGQGRRTALSTAFGCVAAGLIQVPLLALGLASLVASSPVTNGMLRWAGAAYLFYVGLTLLLSQRTAAYGGIDNSPPCVSMGMAFRQGMVCNLTNPTVLAFMLAILPQFAHSSAGSVVAQILILGATMKAVKTIVELARVWEERATGNSE
jgi:threonine/homoserine/homoserine lactone efflux protein